MIGAILGDVVGSIYEFDNIKTKDFELFDKECFFTDDSVMTIAVAEALMRYKHIDAENIDEFKEELITVIQNVMGHKEIKTTLEIYTHVTEAKKREEVNALETRFAWT